jgi:hypothetical protein
MFEMGQVFAVGTPANFHVPVHGPYPGGGGGRSVVGHGTVVVVDGNVVGVDGNVVGGVVVVTTGARQGAWGAPRRHCLMTRYQQRLNGPGHMIAPHLVSSALAHAATQSALDAPHAGAVKSTARLAASNRFFIETSRFPPRIAEDSATAVEGT